MGLTSLQVCMDSSDHWLQGTIHEENGMDSSSSPSTGDILACSRPLMERKLRPPHDQALKCPRCDSTHTKFCYYNNYSLTQPRYFCKSCRRYWTKGGTLRNIPVGGGCRKNKKVSSKKSNDHHQSIISQNHNVGSSSSSANNINPTDLHLSFPDMQFSQLANFVEMNNHGCSFGNHPGNNFMDTKYNFMLENHAPIDFMETKYESLVGNGELGLMGGVDHHDMTGINFPGLCSPFPGIFQEMNNGNMVDTFQRHHLMVPYESQDPDQDQDQGHQNAALDVKPNTAKLLSLDWHDHQQAGKAETFGYHGGLGSSWTGLMNGYGSSATNPLV